MTLWKINITLYKEIKAFHPFLILKYPFVYLKGRITDTNRALLPTWQQWPQPRQSETSFLCVFFVCTGPKLLGPSPLPSEARSRALSSSGASGTSTSTHTDAAISGAGLAFCATMPVLTHLYLRWIHTTDTWADWDEQLKTSVLDNIQLWGHLSNDHL